MCDEQKEQLLEELSPSEPTVLISFKEISFLHNLVEKCINTVAPSANDGMHPVLQVRNL